MWQAIIGFFGGPVIRGLLDAYNAHLQATTSDKQIAADLAGKEIAAQTVEIQEQQKLKTAEIGHAWEPEKLAYYIVLIFSRFSALERRTLWPAMSATGPAW
ncbi:hypothetical protein [Bradyrhizobium pachyrhizi]|uniref:hypothetical protein n=1 Tax=Bradyrhizobium pachyrhizi TaxID=280333 RepID=UPI0009E82A25|nr:hypothetical protein [Bradyrhizobium pachyrhizi]